MKYTVQGGQRPSRMAVGLCPSGLLASDTANRIVRSGLIDSYVHRMSRHWDTTN
jgi:hypothetical protein